MIRHAAKCSVEQPFLIMSSPEEQLAMLHAVRNALTLVNQDGEAAEEAGLPVSVETVNFAVTVGDASENATQLVRVQICLT